MGAPRDSEIGKQRPRLLRRWQLHKFIIEREIPAVGTFEREQLREAAKTSNAALAELGPDIQWVQSYVADDKTFCVYLAKDEAVIRRHAEISGFPASRITEIRKSDRPDHRVELSYGPLGGAIGHDQKCFGREHAHGLGQRHPANALSPPSCASILRASFHFAIRSDRANEPTFS
jgi:hypothetical protein